MRALVSDSLQPHGIFQARILVWVAIISYSVGSSQPRDRTRVSFISCIFLELLPPKQVPWELYKALNKDLPLPGKKEEMEKLGACGVCSVMSDTLRPRGLQPARLLLSLGFYRQEYWTGLPFEPISSLKG